MPPKAAAASGDGERKQPTPQEAYLFYTIIKNMKGKPEVDWVAVAADNGFKNAETAKVRYGQIKRKLGLENWNPPNKSKEARGEGDPSVPETPTTGRTKKTATPSTAGTGAGVKKRASTGRRATNPNSGGGGCGRKAKAQVLIKDEDDDDDNVFAMSSPNPKNGAGPAVKNEFENLSISMHHPADSVWADFPEVLPPEVLGCRAVLSNVNGEWIRVPVTVEVHAQWRAGLPARIQNIFYSQANANNNGNGHVNDEHGDAGAQAQLLSENFEAGRAQGHGRGNNNGVQVPAMPAAANISMPSPMAVEMGFFGNGGDGRIDLNSIPMHPGYLEQRLREQETEQRDMEQLFGGQANDAGDA